ncbi:hypothetical protein BDZ89DRAFT_1132694 [Hymenopellis radicata]|nr:hypothetical protein BDZ89DRAFT_1132694 [Hymenopellis radicata]
MASTASSSTATSSSSSPEQRPQAEPLPVKRGEIGYSENLAAGEAEGGRANTPLPDLPARHPADRDAPPPPPVVSSSSPVPIPTVVATSAPPSHTDDASSTNSVAKARKRFRFWKPKRVPSFGGIRLTTFLIFLVQFAILAGTVAAWALSIQVLMRQTPDESGAMKTNGNTSSIFVHVVFAIGVLGQLLFLERRVYRIRAERYAYVHPGEVLPTSSRRGLRAMDTSIAYAPWNRAPLPTYAAALAESGVGTGDVEDHIIAQPPPPPYGNTRGSTLLLSGFLRNSLRAQRPVSENSQQDAGGRPLSYASNDEEWEVIQDADRARKLEETLSKLERPT